ncbi:MAG TPA: NlpC/P60 family protein [Pirellulales bacterium]
MSILLSRRQTLGLLTLGGIAPGAVLSSVVKAFEAPSHDKGSDYGLAYSGPIDELIGDLLHGERGDPQRESATPHHDWYSEHVRRRMGAWGPSPRLYPPIMKSPGQSLEWKRERVIATGARFIGYSYQHHHIPDWDPPAGWPWKVCCAGHNGRGVDCSNFTSFVYNQGFGIKISSGIGRQARTDHGLVEGHPVRIERVELPTDYDKRVEALHTGDLVYIRGREDGPVTHVVIWVGSIGRATSGLPLLMDSHGGDVKDDHGHPIPCGIHLRPFRQDSWYNRCASHAHRVFHEGHA